ncbi:activase, partial [bacterium]
HYGNEFICAGGKEKCDRKCGISMIEVDGKKYPFGGACNKYYNERYNIKSDPGKNDLVKIRQDLVFNKYCIATVSKGKRVGITKSLLSNTLYPLYYNFFSGLGCEVILADNVDSGGNEKIRSSYCYPVEVSHGLFQDLIKKDVEYIFLPHITQMESKSEFKYKRLCVFVQGETYFLRSAFRDNIEDEKGKLVFNLLSPVIDLAAGRESVRKVFEDIAKEMGFAKSEGRRSFDFAYDTYKTMLAEFRELGKQALLELESSPGKFAAALFGRAYNAFAGEVNLNIPHKLASKNIMVIPHDFLPSEEYASYENMYWYTGHQILASARFVKDHEQLYGVFITNFSCGPDSFIIPYFRKIMGTKPSLTLELDSHSADVGIDTRIDAAMDIIRNYIELKNTGQLKEKIDVRKHLRVVTEDKHITIIDTKGNKSNIKSGNLDVLIPSMGRFSTDAFSAIFRSLGINSRPLPVPTFETLKYGRSVTTCKECLPFLITTGSLIEYVRENKDKGRKVLFFMPHGYGPCRQGQYVIRLKDIIDGMDFEDVGIISMDDENSFDDFGSEFFTKQWAALIIADVVHDMENAIMVLADDKDSGLKLLEMEWKNILKSLETGNLKEVYAQLRLTAGVLSSINLKKPLHSAKTVSMIGEIYVRREEFSRIDLVKTLIEHEFVVKTAPITEYVYYTNYLQKHGIVGGLGLKDKVKVFLKDRMQIIIEKKIKKILSVSGLCSEGLIDIEKTLRFGKDLISEKLIGESILTTGLALRDILDEACGVISIGPFNCIPSRLAEAILSKEMTLEGKYRFGHIKRNGYPQSIADLPYLHVESDGNAFPQITQSKIEIFIMQAERLHNAIQAKKKEKEKA